MHAILGLSPRRCDASRGKPCLQWCVVRCISPLNALSKSPALRCGFSFLILLSRFPSHHDPACMVSSSRIGIRCSTSALGLYVPLHAIVSVGIIFLDHLSVTVPDLFECVFESFHPELRHPRLQVVQQAQVCNRRIHDIRILDSITARIIRKKKVLSLQLFFLFV